MTQKILCPGSRSYAGTGRTADRGTVGSGVSNDITSPVAIEMDKMKVQGVFDKDKIALVPDHFVPNKDIKSAEHCKCVREFCKTIMRSPIISKWERWVSNMHCFARKDLP